MVVISLFYSPQGLIDRARLAQSLLFRARSIDDKVREFALLVERHLAAQPRLHLLARHAVAFHGSLYLLLFLAYSHDELIEPRWMPISITMAASITPMARA